MFIFLSFILWTKEGKAQERKKKLQKYTSAFRNLGPRYVIKKKILESLGRTYEMLTLYNL